MPISTLDPDGKNLSIVLQGHLKIGWDIRYSGQFLKSLFPASTLILSTSEHDLPKADVKTLRAKHGYDMFDDIVTSPDPGGLPDLKWWGQANNANRQIITSAAGLKRVKTDFAMKLRTDAYLLNTKIVDVWAKFSGQPRGDFALTRERVLTLSYFTLHPRFDERMSFHVSDWFQLGLAEDLLKLWDLPFYDFATAIWYETRPHAEGSFPREREFRSRFAVEQWNNLNFIAKDRPFPIQYHNEISEDITLAYEQYIADNFVILHPDDVGFTMPKHKWVFRHAYLNAICYSHLDWVYLAKTRSGCEVDFPCTQVWPILYEDREKLVRRRNMNIPKFIKDALCLFPSMRRVYK